MSNNIIDFKEIIFTKIAQWRYFTGLDFHVLATLFFRGWAVFAGGATILLLPLWLSPIEQGYYFTFSSILALQVFFELGLNQIIMQLVSHEVAHLHETADGTFRGEASRLDRLSSLAILIQRWYRIIALFFALIGGAVGIIFFKQKNIEQISFLLEIWIILIGATAINLWLSPKLSVMEGCGKVGQVARLRLIQSILGYSCFWIMLLSGSGLFASIAIPIIGAACTTYWLKLNGYILKWLPSRVIDIKNELRWRNDIFPLQWRIALSWASGYLIFNLFIPVVFSRYGAIEAGRLGMALTVFSSISTIGMSWVNAKAPNFTMYISRGERKKLNTVFQAVFFRSVLATALLSLGIVVLGWYLNYLEILLMMRISSPKILMILAGVTIANSMVFSMAIYMRAHREEPMLIQSIIVGLIIGFGVYFISIIGIFEMMFFYMIVSIAISFPWTAWIFLKYFKRQ